MDPRHLFEVLIETKTKLCRYVELWIGRIGFNTNKNHEEFIRSWEGGNLLSLMEILGNVTRIPSSYRG